MIINYLMYHHKKAESGILIWLIDMQITIM